MAINHKNFAQTTLGAAIESVDGTSITVTSEAGFPAVDFIISIDTEAMLVTNVSTTTWTVTRGYEGSTAATHTNGTAIYHNWSAGEADNQKVIKRFTTAMTSAAFATMVADMTIDIIEMAAGTYQDWAAVDLSVNRSTRPLTVRPAPGAAVVWDGSTDDSTDGLFYFGNSALCSYITFDPEGTGGSFTIQNYTIGQTGLVNTGWASHVTVNGFKTRTCTESAASGSTRWSVYVGTDAAHRGDNLTFNDWDSYPGAALNHFQINTATYGADVVTARRWRAYGGTYGVALRGDSTLVLIDGWTLDTVTIPFDNEVTSATVSNCVSINSGAVQYLDPSDDGGGNHWNSPAVHYAEGNRTKLFASGDTIGRMNLVRMASTGEWMQADKDTAANSTGLLGIALEAKNDGQLMLVALPGSFVRDDSWAWTVGATLYVGDAEVTETAPTAADDIVRIVGYAVTTKIIWFDPEEMVITATGRNVLDDTSTADQLTTLGAMSNADATVTYAKMQHVSATDKILGRSTAGAGDVEEIACTATGRSILDDTSTAAVCTTIGALPLAGGTMSGDMTLGENTAVALDPAGSADEKWSGITVTGIAAAALAVGDLCYLTSAFKWDLADADAASTGGSVALGLCVLAAAGDTSATRMLLLGTMRSAAFPASITGGAQLYVSTTAGDMTTTQPTGVDDVIRVVGWAILTEPNTIYFNPSSDFITRTA